MIKFPAQSSRSGGPVLGNLYCDQRHGHDFSRFGASGEPGAAHSLAVEFIYTGESVRRLERISMPLMFRAGSPQVLSRLVDVGRNSLVAVGIFTWQDRPARTAQVLSLCRQGQGDGIVSFDSEGLRPYHHYRLSMMPGLITGHPLAPGFSAWG